eukprot:5507023-Amphidinium_carterae.1
MSVAVVVLVGWPECARRKTWVSKCKPQRTRYQAYKYGRGVTTQQYDAKWFHKSHGGTALGCEEARGGSGKQLLGHVALYGAEKGY